MSIEEALRQSKEPQKLKAHQRRDPKCATYPTRRKNPNPSAAFLHQISRFIRFYDMVRRISLLLAQKFFVTL